MAESMALEAAIRCSYCRLPLTVLPLTVGDTIDRVAWVAEPFMIREQP